MIKIERKETEKTKQAIADLQKASENESSYNIESVNQALKEIFHGKCYICENKAVTSYQIEHLVPHRGDKTLKYDWKNLFWSCAHCNNIKSDKYEPILDCTKEPVEKCPYCGSDKVTFGVFDRIELIKDKKETKSPENRPPYIYQVPLGFIPGVGGKTIEKLLDNFETEMNILHKLSKDDIEAVVGEKVANSIEKARTGNAKVQSGGGGNYGKII